MKMIILRCSIIAVIIFIPLTSIQHFIEPLSDCLLADICNHTWVPECAEDLNIPHKRLFIDECDIYEFNCDNDVKYLIVNYSDCFGPMTCPTLPPHKYMRQGNYLYRANDRRIIYSPTVKGRTTLPMKTKAGRRRYTPEKAKRRYMKNKIMTTDCAPCMRTKSNMAKPQRKALQKPPKPKKRTTKRTKKHTAKRTTKRTTKPMMKRTRRITTRLTTQVIRTATTGTVVLRKMTVIKNGMMLFKVVKGYDTTTEKEDSDFLE